MGKIQKYKKTPVKNPDGKNTIHIEEQRHKLQLASDQKHWGREDSKMTSERKTKLPTHSSIFSETMLQRQR